MPHYYDPWMHGLHLALSRIIQFVLLTLLVSASLWTWLLVRFYDCGWRLVVGSAWAIAHGEGETHWQIMFWQSVAIGVLVASNVFTLLHGRAKLRRGDRHRRGARVVRDDDHNDD